VGPIVAHIVAHVNSRFSARVPMPENIFDRSVRISIPGGYMGDAVNHLARPNPAGPQEEYHG
jgi:hypothetical protein